MHEWHHASRIALGWLLNLCAFVGMLCIYAVYGCTVRSLSAEDNSQVPDAPRTISIVNGFSRLLCARPQADGGR